MVTIKVGLCLRFGGVFRSTKSCTSVNGTRCREIWPARSSGRYNVSFTETSEFGPNDSALFLIASTMGPVISRGPGKTRFDAIEGENYFLAIAGYSRTQQTFNLTIAPSEVGEMPTLAAFSLGLSLLCWTCKQRRASR